VSAGSCQITFTTSGDRTLTATYQGDGSFASSTGTATHHVNEATPPPNNPPVAQADAYSTPVNQSLHVDAPGVLLNDTDPDAGDHLTASLNSEPVGGGFVILQADGAFDYFPAGAVGQDSFTYTVSDGTLSSTATVTIQLQE
jgi:hypothetical protein